jgi:hypothetical protein
MTFIPSSRNNIPDQFENDAFAPFNSEDDFFLDDDGNPVLEDPSEELTEEEVYE